MVKFYTDILKHNNRIKKFIFDNILKYDTYILKSYSKCKELKIYARARARACVCVCVCVKERK